MSDVEESVAGGLSRRTVVRTAANAAWMVPAISLITEAPALAASGDTIAFGAGTGSWSGTLLGIGVPTLSLNIPINLSTRHSSQATGLQVTVSFNSAPTKNLTPNAPSGWTVTPTKAGKGPFTFTKSTNAQVPTVTFNPSFDGPLGLLSAYPMAARATVTLVASAGSTVTTPAPAGFTSTGLPGGATSVTGTIVNSN